MALLSVKDLHVSYGAIKAVQGISFDINQGEIVTLIGANGAGKSTTLNTVAGIIKPDSGSIEFKGESLVGVKAHKIVEKGLALCPEGRRVFAQMTVAENLEMGGYTRTDAENAETLEIVYERFPRLKERMNQTAGTLSGGEQQMLAMGRAERLDGALHRGQGLRARGRPHQQDRHRRGPAARRRRPQGLPRRLGLRHRARGALHTGKLPRSQSCERERAPRLGRPFFSSVTSC